MSGHLDAENDSQSPLAGAVDDAETPRSTLAAMKAARRWLMHRSKVPYYVNGLPRGGPLDSPEDVAQLATYEQACEAVKRLPGFALGFALGPDGPGCWQGVDLDNIEANGLCTEANALPAYVEVSPSGQGAHAIGYGTPFPSNLGSDGSGVEAYSKARFFTFTGNEVRDGPLCDLFEYTRDVLLPRRKSLDVMQPATTEAHAAHLDASTIGQLKGALGWIDANSYETWMKIGHALKTVGEAGYDLWVAWSATSPKFKSDEANRKWKSFNPTGTSYKAVFAEAQRAGWPNPGYARDVALIGVPRQPFVGQAGGPSGVQLQEPFDARNYDPTQYVPATAVQPQSSGADVVAGWPVPTPLPDALPAVQPFDPELLPIELRGWIMDIAHRMQCPPDFPAVAALVALSSLIGARAVIQPKARDDWTVVPNLWGVCVGRPGVKKSPALSEALKPLHRLQAAEHERWRVLHDEWELDAKVAELAKDGREGKAKRLASHDPAQARALLQSDDHGEPEPAQRRFIVNDATVEKLGELLAANPWGTLSYRDELYGLLTGMDKQGQEGARGFYLQAYDGNGGYTFDRIMRGTVHIPRACLAMLGSIQPGRIQEYVRGAVAGGSADDGLLQRFGLMVWPDTNAAYLHVDQWPDTPARKQASAVFERLAQLEPSAGDQPALWRFSPQAQAIFVQWLVPFECELRRDDMHPALVSHLAKYRKLIPALALIFAMIDVPGNGGIVGERELVRALAWGEYLRTHAVRLYSAAVQPEAAGARTLLAKIKAGKLVDADGVMLDAFTPRQVAQKCWTGLGSPEAVRKAADLLAEWDHLRAESTPIGPAGGRPSERYRINPHALRGDA